jgi:hypothetical protein
MERRKQSRGRCGYCGREMTKGGLSRHLAECPQRQEAIAAADRGTGETQTLYHLKVEDAYNSDFWLHLEMSGTATLKKLDDYLRAIWLECCGHMSEFSLGGWGSPKVGKAKKAEQVFQPGVQLMHIYDFGTSSETRITVVAAREGKPTTRHPIALMARNDMPPAVCIQCEAPATHLCMECLIEEESAGTLCAAHAKRHPHKDYGDPIPLVNSPRLGMCGYDGPAEPPY